MPLERMKGKNIQIFFKTCFSDHYNFYSLSWLNNMVGFELTQLLTFLEEKILFQIMRQ